jgi:hypothetical protein
MFPLGPSTAPLSFVVITSLLNSLLFSPTVWGLNHWHHGTRRGLAPFQEKSLRIPSVGCCPVESIQRIVVSKPLDARKSNDILVTPPSAPDEPLA